MASLYESMRNDGVEREGQDPCRIMTLKSSLKTALFDEASGGARRRPRKTPVKTRLTIPSSAEVTKELELMNRKMVTKAILDAMSQEKTSSLLKEIFE